MKKKVLIIFILIVLIAGVAFTYQNFFNNQSITEDSSPEISITYENLASILSQSKIVKDLPSDATISVKFYNYSTGQREIEKSYLMKKSLVAESDNDGDINIFIHSKYIEELTNKNFCNIIQKAKSNNNLGVETQESATELAWKFKSMIAYKDCLGF